MGKKKKTKACLNLELIAGKEIAGGVTFDKHFSRNCSDYNETAVRKILEVRESFESSRKSTEAEKGGTTSVKRLARAEDGGGTGEETATKERGS